MKTRTVADELESILAVLALAIPVLACDRGDGDGVGTRNGAENAGADPAADDGDDDDDDDDDAGVCGAAAAVDDACEAAVGDDADACTPFDDVDEACEAGSEDDECELAE